MRIAAGFLAGWFVAMAVLFAALGGLFARVLSGADDFDPDDDPFDVFPFTTS